ncbi:MAG: RNA polymerase factor sigma-32 [Bacteriovoracaceae bacterium]|nr:RNA polymerase factor sigma-32 [Bacteriovoracaceae bacterium]
MTKTSKNMSKGLTKSLPSDTKQIVVEPEILSEKKSSSAPSKKPTLKNDVIEVIEVSKTKSKPSSEEKHLETDEESEDFFIDGEHTSFHEDNNEDQNEDQNEDSEFSTELVHRGNADFIPQTFKSEDALSQYIKQIAQYKLLTSDEEKALVKELESTGDVEVAKKLVLANLRLVVKIAMEYRTAWQNMMDLIQEGNIGLMKAVSKYDSTKGAKLSYYASWWIRSYILKFILDNFRLVKIGTTNEQKKLFFNLLKEKDRLLKMGITPDAKLVGENLGVSEKAVQTMEGRLSSTSGDVSLDYRPSEGGLMLQDYLMDENELSIDDKLADLQSVEILKEHLQTFLKDLKERDREIFEKRLLSEVPQSLQSIADEYGVSRERIRQIEERLIKNLKVYMSEYLR